MVPMPGQSPALMCCGWQPGNGIETTRPRVPTRCRSLPRLGTHRLGTEMATPQHQPHRTESRELPVETVLERAKPHPPYGEHIIDDLTDDEAEAFLDAALR